MGCRKTKSKPASLYYLTAYETHIKTPSHFSLYNDGCIMQTGNDTISE